MSRFRALVAVIVENSSKPRGSRPAIANSYFPAQKACFPKAASESPAVHPTNDKTRRFVPGEKAPFELMSAGRDHSADCLVMAQLILTRLSAITPRPTQRCIPASPL